MLKNSVDPIHPGQHVCDADLAPKRMSVTEGAAAGVRSYAVDPDAARRLWEVSEEMVGARFAG